MIDISSCLSISGWMSELELEWLATQASKSYNIIEVGSWSGRSTMALALHCPGTVWAVDTWVSLLGGTVDDETKKAAAQAYLDFSKSLSKFLLNGKVNLLQQDSLEAATALYRFAGVGTFDMVFIDGAHDYDRVRAEIGMYMPLLRAGGVLSGHDLGHADVNRAVRELLPDHHAVPNTQIWWTVKGQT